MIDVVELKNSNIMTSKLGLKLLGIFLDELSTKYSNAGCNDFDVSLLKEKELEELKEWFKEVGEEFFEMDISILDMLRKKFGI